MADDLGPILPLPGEPGTSSDEATSATTDDVPEGSAGMAAPPADAGPGATTPPSSDSALPPIADPDRGAGTIRGVPEGGPTPG